MPRGGECNKFNRVPKARGLGRNPAVSDSDSRAPTPRGFGKAERQARPGGGGVSNPTITNGHNASKSPLA